MTKTGPPARIAAAPPRPTVRLSVLAAVLCWLLIAVVYLKSPLIWRADSKWVVLQGVSLVRNGDLNLDEYPGLMSPDDRSVQRIRGHTYSQYPVAIPILVAPLIQAIDGPLLKRGVDLASNVSARATLELITAALITATAALVLHLAVFVATASNRLAAIGSLTFAFCTSAWSTASRALWQHGPSNLFVSGAICSFLLGEKSPRWLWCCGACVAASYAVRPSNWVVVVCMSVCVLLRFRKAALGYFLAAAPIAVALIAYHYSLYELPLSPYYLGYVLDGETWVAYRQSAPVASALAGNLVSPARGLFVYSPVFLLSFARRLRSMELVDWLAIAAVVMHWIAISMSWPWWGGHCHGARLFSDASPWLVILLVRGMQGWRWPDGRALAFVVLALASAAINGCGATRLASVAWNWHPTDIDSDVGRLWDWKDPPFLR